MILGKALILKGLAGVTALSGGVGFCIVGHKNDWWISKDSPKSPANEVKEETAESLIENAGLTCTFTSNDCEITTLGSSKKINVKYDDNTKKDDINSISVSDSAKIKVQKNVTEGDYNKNLKLTIEGGNITLTGGSGSETISKLEEFETYEIKKDDTNQKYYLKRKTKVSEGIKTALGLPEDCDLSTDSGCTDKEVNSESIKKINFDGKTTGQDVTLSGTTKLTVTKEDTTDPDFPYGYKFVFKADSSNATIAITSSKSVTVKTNTGTEFRIKKDSTNNTISLEEAWTKERLLEKVGLQCNGGSNDECTLKSGKNINIKQDNDKLENKSLESSNQGKIKLYTTDAEDYNKGFRFVIEEKDISITNETNKKLEQFETYEIKEDGTGANKKWYFSRKKKASEEIKKALGLPDGCNLPTTVDSQEECCDITGEDLKKIKFDGKTDTTSTITVSGSPKLKITKISDTTTYPLGYKFTFETTEDLSIPKTSNSDLITIKKKTNTEFKIKKENQTLTLEKAWTVKSLGEKVGLSCPEPSNGEKTCTFNDNSINVNNGNNGNSNKIDGAKVKDGEGNSKKLKYEEDQEGYNQGFKFTVDGGATIELTKGEDNSTTLNIENNGTTYEIKQDSNDNKWYLTKYTAVAS